jgi:hypothetical protein
MNHRMEICSEIARTCLMRNHLHVQPGNRMVPSRVLGVTPEVLQGGFGSKFTSDTLRPIDA